MQAGGELDRNLVRDRCDQCLRDLRGSGKGVGRDATAA